MQGMLCDKNLAQAVVGLISLRDATRFAVSCRQAMEGAQIFGGAIGFALTRPGAASQIGVDSTCSRPHAGDNLLDMNLWKFFWESCAQSVAAAGLDPSTLALSELVSDTFHRDDDGDLSVRSVMYGECVGFDFLSCLLKLAQENIFQAVKLVQKPCETAGIDIYTEANTTGHADIAVILMADLHWERDDRDFFCSVCIDSGLSLVGLSNGWFALIFWKSHDVGGDELFAGAAVYIGKTIPALFDLVSTTTGETIGWKLADDGTLTLSSVAAFDSLPRTMCRAWRSLPCPRTRNDAHVRNAIAFYGRRARLAKTLSASWNADASRILASA